MKKNVLYGIIILTLLIGACTPHRDLKLDIPPWSQVKTIEVKQPEWRQKFATPEGCTLVIKKEKKDLEDYLNEKQRYFSTEKESIRVFEMKKDQKEVIIRYDYENREKLAQKMKVTNKAVQCGNVVYAAEFFCVDNAQQRNEQRIQESLASMICE